MYSLPCDTCIGRNQSSNVNYHNNLKGNYNQKATISAITNSKLKVPSNPRKTLCVSINHSCVLGSIHVTPLLLNVKLKKDKFIL